MEFREFPKIARLNREVIVTEKIDGTNAQVTIVPASEDQDPNPSQITTVITAVNGQYVDTFHIYAGSRNRFITPEADNFGFARWVKENAVELVKLGPGSHFGEWWGSGIQRGYGLPAGEKRFSLFNVSRWSDPATRPACCHVVPELARGVIGKDFELSTVLERLRTLGSQAAPFMNPEGIVIYHTAAQQLFKVTLEKDEEPKGFRK